MKTLRHGREHGPKVAVLARRGANYWPVLGSFNNCNIILLSPKSTSSDTFDEIHQVVIDGISDNTASLVESGTYEAINTTDTSTNGFYVIMFTLGAYTLQEITKN